MPIAVPTPTFVLRRLGFERLYHYTRLAALDGIVRRVTGRPSLWTDCEVVLNATSGFSAPGRLLRDYSVLDFEIAVSGRGSYTYFFAGEPSAWGLRKNLGVSADVPAEDQGFGIVSVTLDDLLRAYHGPVFYRPDDRAAVIRGGYAGPAQVLPLPHRIRALAPR